jgi:hypothetical protein
MRLGCVGFSMLRSRKNVSRVNSNAQVVRSCDIASLLPNTPVIGSRACRHMGGRVALRAVGTRCQIFLVPRPTRAVSGPNRCGCPTELVHHVAQRCPPKVSANLPGAEKATILVDDGGNVSNPHSPSCPFLMRWVASCSSSSLPGFSPPNPYRLQSEETRPPPLRLNAATSFSFPSLAEEPN